MEMLSGELVLYFSETAPMALAKSKRPVIKTLQEVGRYAIGIVWNDGHDSIFPLEEAPARVPMRHLQGSM